MKDEYKITYDDLVEIVRYAKSQYVHFKIPMNLSGELIHGEEAIKALLIDSIVVLLNKRGLLNKTVKLDEKL